MKQNKTKNKKDKYVDILHKSFMSWLVVGCIKVSGVRGLVNIHEDLKVTVLSLDLI